jgi:hypothetical protein
LLSRFQKGSGREIIIQRLRKAQGKSRKEHGVSGGGRQMYELQEEVKELSYGTERDQSFWWE